MFIFFTLTLLSMVPAHVNLSRFMCEFIFYAMITELIIEVFLVFRQKKKKDK